MQIIPVEASNLLDKWEIRSFVLISLSLHTILILFGNKRKRNSRIKHRIFVWLAYMLADGLATMSLGIIQYKGRKPEGKTGEPENIIVGFWPPFLLLHLGGPDTITAYSMEDNELWLRQLLKFGVQVGVAVYIFLRAWTNSHLNILAIPMLISGIIKIGERLLALWSASSVKFKESLFPQPDPGPNYASYMEALASGRKEGFKVDVKDLIESPSADLRTLIADKYILTADGNYSTPDIINIAHNFLETVKRLFGDLILSFHDVSESRLSIENGLAKDVFKIIEVELGFMSDEFYTKVVVIYSAWAAFLSFISSSCIIVVFCAFCVMDKSQYQKQKVDVHITYVLLIGAIILEIYSVISLLYSDWTVLRLCKHKNKVTDQIIQAISSSFVFTRKKRWSKNVFQFNLIRYCLKASKQRWQEAIKKRAAKCFFVLLFIRMYHLYQTYMHMETKDVSDELMELIFGYFCKKIRKAKEMFVDEKKVAQEIKRFCAHKGDKVFDSLEFSIDLEGIFDMEFDRSILLWHIATDLCYNSVMDEYTGSSRSPSFRETSKLLSDYMMYILVWRPSMLPNGISEIRFQDTCAEATEFVKGRESIQDERQACQRLLEVRSDQEEPSKVKGDKSKSVLFDGCRLAKGLQKCRDKEKMWKVITFVWVEMLAYAACHCQGIHHAQQLRRGGELLTHVWLLMAHLGITEKFQISEGHARIKLRRK